MGRSIVVTILDFGSGEDANREGWNIDVENSSVSDSQSPGSVAKVENRAEMN